ncbi:MAG: acyl-CoA dehydratase activase-related protein [Solirubrobacterales bacterium]
MKVGIPNALLHCGYKNFIETFFIELGAEIVISPDTNKNLLDQGVKCCIDEACLPIKIFHGHAAYLKDKCDILFIPRFMQLNKNEYICPKFCGLAEMVINNIPHMPIVTSYPLYYWDKSNMVKWAENTGKLITNDNNKIKNAFITASKTKNGYPIPKHQEKYPIKVALAGHPYNIYDSFVNMNLVHKLNKLNIGVYTEQWVEDCCIKTQVNELSKRPFWTFTKNNFGFTLHLARNKKVHGIIYVSSFGCGTDSITVELIKNRLKDFPFLLLKIDEQTGEAGVQTRIEAFKDMLERR